MNRIAIGPICPIGTIATYNQETLYAEQPNQTEDERRHCKSLNRKGLERMVRDTRQGWRKEHDAPGDRQVSLREAKCRAVVVSNGYGHVRTANRETRAS